MRERRLEKACPDLVVDACYEHVRESRHVMSEGVLTPAGINEQGYREVIAVAISSGEDKSSWGEILRRLIERDLESSKVACVTSDDHLGPW